MHFPKKGCADGALCPDTGFLMPWSHRLRFRNTSALCHDCHALLWIRAGFNLTLRCKYCQIPSPSHRFPVLILLH